MKDDYALDEAYQIEDAKDAQKLYDAWAETYDESFGQGWGYVAPQRIGDLFLAAGGAGPILDIGAGTGLVVEHMAPRMAPHMADGIDISAEMLAKARAKGIYRNLYEADLLQPLDLPDESYAGFVSCGTFTHGHVGPACLPELLRVARPGALFVCGTIAPVFDGMGFGSALAKLVAAQVISPVQFHEIAIYEGADHDHAGDTGLVMEFRKQ